MEEGNFTAAVRGIYQLFAIWTTVDSDTVIHFAKDVYDLALKSSDVEQMREACGLGSVKFQKLGRAICAWQTATILSTHGYRGRTKDKLVLACLQSCEQIMRQKLSTLVISEWVEDVYEELSPFSKQPLRIRVYASEKAGELRELLQTDSLPTVQIRN